VPPNRASQVRRPPKARALYGTARVGQTSRLRNALDEPARLKRCANSTKIKRQQKRTPRKGLITRVLVWRPNGPGTGLFSRGLVTPVSWALERFTAVFGMGTGGTTPLSPPGPIGRHASDA
jgi:hypothetical protein